MAETTLEINCKWRRLLRALSFCMENPVVLVVSQVEQTFPLEIFRKKKENLQWFSSFLVFAEMIGKSCHHLLCPTSAMLLDKLKARFVIVVR